MSGTITPTTLPDVFILTPVNFTLTVKDSASAAANITSVIVTPAAQGINTSFDSTTGIVTVTGQYPISLFSGVSITYITKGKSDKTDTPVTVGSFDAIPQGKQVFKYAPPPDNQVVTKYTVNFIDSVTKLPDTAFITQNVEFDYTAAGAKLKDYV